MTYIGIDTSNYTTSVGAVCGDTYFNERVLLPVKEGMRGLRQSDALFLHIRQFSSLYKKAIEGLDKTTVKAIGVSTTPRSVNGSYMPVFIAGECFANIIASDFEIPCYSFSHQDGHIMAGLYSANGMNLLDREFISVHLSGGTTEILRCHYKNGGFNAEIIGETKDISAGQLIDRVGVALGISFPCGKHMETLMGNCNDFCFPVSVSESMINFSGAETKALRSIGTMPTEKIICGIFTTIAESISSAVNAAVRKTGINDVLIVGGVASNKYLRCYFKQRIGAIFASTELSTDNAVGTALLAKYKELY